MGDEWLPLYCAVLLFECTVDGRDPVYREDVALLRAASEREAWDKARARGEFGTHEYENVDGQRVRWTVKHVVTVAPALTEDLEDPAGADVLSRFFRDVEANRRFESGSGSDLWVAVLLFTSAGGGEADLYREDVVLLRAADERAATESARAHGVAQEGTIVNDRGERVRTSLRAVVDVSPCLEDDLDAPVVDLYARHFRDVRAYESFEARLSGEPL